MNRGNCYLPKPKADAEDIAGHIIPVSFLIRDSMQQLFHYSLNDTNDSCLEFCVPLIHLNSVRYYFEYIKVQSTMSSELDQLNNYT